MHGGPKVGKGREDEASGLSEAQKNRYLKKGPEHFNILSTCVTIPIPTSSISASMISQHIDLELFTCLPYPLD